MEGNRCGLLLEKAWLAFPGYIFMCTVIPHSLILKYGATIQELNFRSSFLTANLFVDMRESLLISISAWGGNDKQKDSDNKEALDSKASDLLDTGSTK